MRYIKLHKEYRLNLLNSIQSYSFALFLNIFSIKDNNYLEKKS